MTREERIRTALYSAVIHGGMGLPAQRCFDVASLLVPVVAALLDAERPRCDCGGAVTVCADCAVADYQAQRPDCTTCCPAPPKDAP